MTTATLMPPRPPAPPATPPGAGGDLAAGALLLLAVSATTCWLLGLPTSHLLLTAALYLPFALLVRGALPPDRERPGIGPANRVTLARATLVLPVVALVPEALGGTLGELGQWWIVALSTTAMVLDGVDGRVARRTRTGSPFGARFDMEVDALLLVALCGVLWGSGRVGAWVLLIGGLRYVFVLAGLPLPALRGALPRSLRRKTVCVVQGVALIVGVAPVIPPAAAAALLTVALLLLAYSFAVDVAWLLRVAPSVPLGARG